MSKPRLTQVVSALTRGGAERMVFDLISCLKDRYDIRLLSVIGGEMEAEFRSLGIDVVLSPVGNDKLGLMKFFARELREHRPDILHTHLGGDIWAGFVAHWQKIHPWISTIHNEDHDDPWSRTLLRRFAARRADHIVCVSHEVKAYAHAKFGAPQSAMSVIPNGIDLTTIQQRPPRPFRDVPQLLCIGRLVTQKGQETLLKALARVKRPWRLDICGDGPERLRLERLTESLGMLPRVRFVGVVNDVRRRLAEADLFCLPSRWEGQGIVVLEAAASATPLLLSDLPVFHEWFDETSAQFVPVDDVEAWATSIEQSLQQPAFAIQSAQRARAIVLERGTREKMAEAYDALYTHWLHMYAHSSGK